MLLELLNGVPEVVPPRHRRLGVGRVGVVRWIMNAGPDLLGLNLVIKLIGGLLHVRDHGFDNNDSPTFISGLHFRTSSGAASVSTQLSEFRQLYPSISAGETVAGH